MSKPQIDLKFGADLKDFKKGISNIDSSLKQLSGGFSALGGMIGASFIVDEIVQFTSEAVELANQAEGVQRAFDRLNDPNLLSKLRKATSGTVSDLELMKKAVQAKNFRIPMDTLAKGLEFAQIRAQETGQSVDYLVDSFVTGLGRESVMILDNLGISASDLKERMAEGGTMAEAVGQIIDESLKDAGARIETTSMLIDQQRTEINNLKKDIGESLQPAYRKFLEFTKTGFSGLNTLLGDNVSNIEKLVYLATYKVSYLKPIGKYIREIIRGNAEENENLKRSQEENTKSLEEYRNAQKEYDREQKEAAARREEENRQQRLALLEQTNITQDLATTVKSVASEFEELFALTYDAEEFANAFKLDEVSMALEEVEEDVENFTETFNTNMLKIQQSRESLLKGFMQMGYAIESAFTAAFSALEEGETRMQKFSEILIQELRRMVVQLLAAAAAAAILAAIISIAFGGSNVAGAKLFKGFGGGGFGELFGNILGGGETINGNSFGGMLGGGDGLFGNIVGIIKGQDILLATERANNNRTRSRGF